MKKREWKRLAKDRAQELIGLRSELNDVSESVLETDAGLARVWAMLPRASDSVEYLPDVVDAFMRELVTARSCVAAGDRDHALLVLNRCLERYNAAR